MVVTAITMLRTSNLTLYVDCSRSTPGHQENRWSSYCHFLFFQKNFYRPISLVYQYHHQTPICRNRQWLPRSFRTDPSHPSLAFTLPKAFAAFFPTGFLHMVCGQNKEACCQKMPCSLSASGFCSQLYWSAVTVPLPTFIQLNLPEPPLP